MRIAIGGISHESNTFNPTYTELDAFNVIRGNSILSLKVSKFLLKAGVDVIPTIYARALPSGTIKREAYLSLKNELIERLCEAGRVDGVYLILHGAMEVEGIGDGESDLIKAVREVVGDEALISASLDLHGNISPTLLENADILTAYRTAPHRDVEETRIRAANLLLKSLREGLKPRSVMIKPPILLPGELVVTDVEPASTLYGRLDEIDKKPNILSSSMLVGMAWADSPNASASAIIVASDERWEDEAIAEACRLAEAYWSLRERFHYEVEVGSIEDTIRIAEASEGKPIFISDSGDNVTAGAAGDLPLFVEHLLAMKVKRVVVGGIIDPVAVMRCREAGVGSRIRVEIGGRIDRVNGYPLEVRGRVMNVIEDRVVFRSDGVDILLTGRRMAWTTLESFRAFKINPEDYKIVVVKLGYLTPEFRMVAAKSIMALSPGFTDQRLDRLNYRMVKRPLYPLDRDFSWEPPYPKMDEK